MKRGVIIAFGIVLAFMLIGTAYAYLPDCSDFVYDGVHTCVPQVSQPSGGGETRQELCAKYSQSNDVYSCCVAGIDDYDECQQYLGIGASTTGASTSSRTYSEPLITQFYKDYLSCLDSGGSCQQIYDEAYKVYSEQYYEIESGESGKNSLTVGAICNCFSGFITSANGGDKEGCYAQCNEKKNEVRDKEVELQGAMEDAQQDHNSKQASIKTIPSTKNTQNTQKTTTQTQTQTSQQIVQARQAISLAIDSWTGQAVQLPAGKTFDDKGNSVAADTLKLQGLGLTLPKVEIKYNIKNGAVGEVVSATLPEGAGVSKITSTLKQPTADAAMDVSVIYGKDWPLYRGAKGAPDYPRTGNEQVERMLVVNTQNNNKPYADYSQALIEYSMTSSSYAYSSSDSKTTPEQLKSQQDFFKYLQTKSESAQYQPNQPKTSYTFEEFAKLVLGEKHESDAKAVSVAMYNEDKKEWEKLPSWKLDCGSSTCRYVALAPHLSTFAIITGTPSSPAFLIFLTTAIILVIAVIGGFYLYSKFK